MIHITCKLATKENENYLIKYYMNDDYEFSKVKNKIANIGKGGEIFIPQNTTTDIDLEFNKEILYSKNKPIAVPEEIGQWGGQLAKEFKLEGKVKPSDFKNLFNNLNPANEKQLTKVSRNIRRAGYDITFDMNKSISVAALVYNDTRLIEVFDESVEYAMKYIEKDVKTRVRQGGQIITAKLGIRRMQSLHTIQIDL